MAPPLIPENLVFIRQAGSSQTAAATLPPGSTTTQAPSQKSEDATQTTTAPVSTRPRPLSSGRPSRTATPASSTTPTPSPSSTAAPNPMGQAQQGIVITIVALIGAALLAFLGYVVLKFIRIRHKDPKYLPGSWLKKKWTNWDVIGGYGAASTTNSSQSRINRAARSRANIEVNQALDRQNSVRSVITLPPYREMAEMDLERTIGREGERDGVDTVVVFPETADEQETRREDRMQAMYELRLQRRAQRAAREARNSGSITSLENPTSSAVSLTAMDMEAGGSGRTASELTAAILNDRTRRLSEVSYSDVGYSRSDGSRIRSTSTNRVDTQNSANQSSDSMPLLGDAASAGGRSRSGSVLSLNTNVTGSARPSVDTRRDSAEMLTGNGEDGQQRLPPSYDGLEWGAAPPYMSPVSPVSRSNTAGTTSRGRQPGLNLPLVRVIGASNPGSPMDPMDPNRREGPL